MIRRYEGIRWDKMDEIRRKRSDGLGADDG